MKSPDLDDWLPELPPLDGDEEIDDEQDEVRDDLAVPAGSSDSEEDGPDESIDIGECVDDMEAGDDETDDEWELDSGEIDLVGLEDGRTSAQDDEPLLSDEEVDIETAADAMSGDTGEEGLTDSDESFLDDVLPPMDGDGDGDFQDGLLAEVERALDSAQEERWAQCPWNEIEVLSLPLPIGAADGDARVLLEGHAPHGVVLVTTADGVRVSHGGVVEARNWWRELGRGSGSQGPFASVLMRHEDEHVLWLAASDGALFRGEDFGNTWEDAGTLPAPCCAGAIRGKTLLFLCATEPEARLLISEDGRAWVEQALALPSGLLQEGRVWLAASGDALAIGRESGVVVSYDNGRTFSEVPNSSGAAAGVFAGEGSQPPLMIALERPLAEIVLARTEAGMPPEIVASIQRNITHDTNDDEDQGLVGESVRASLSRSVPRTQRASGLVSLCWDSQAEALWVWNRDQLTAWCNRSQH